MLSIQAILAICFAFGGQYYENNLKDTKEALKYYKKGTKSYLCLERIKKLDEKQYHKINFLQKDGIRCESHLNEYIEMCKKEDIPDIEKCYIIVKEDNFKSNLITEYLNGIYSKYDLPMSKVRNMIISKNEYDNIKNYHKELKELNNRIKKLENQTTKKTEENLKYYRQIKPYTFSGIYKDVVIVN
ncbi:hypothetical protein Catovirus_1_97 [Catovirus CTV1]|uniref:Uncharacterized protein n=1 Tax=Catovirus CTV1 TaxID=1977631 RepID=A0A1V0S8L2_9VIRU|nr:hypothetical protein Catovirus_1_97 [Catovirus CTV1]